MLIPLISLGIAIIFSLLLLLLYQEIGFWQKIKIFIHHKKDLTFILGYTSLILALSLGIIGYFGIMSSFIDSIGLQAIRRNLLILSLLLFLVTFRVELLKIFQPITQRITGFLRNYFKPHRHFLLTALLLGFVALAWMAPMASSKVIFSINDHTSHIGYIAQARMALEEGQFPIRVAPLEDFGLRYPGFQFYSQLPYTLGGIIYKFLTPSNPYDAYKIMLWLSLWVGGIFIYRLSLWLTRSPIAAILGGVAYMSAPYFLNNIHARGAFTEAIAQGILPIVLYYVIQVFHRPRLSHLIFSALAWFALGTTHLITFVYSTLLIGFLGLILIWKTPIPDWKVRLKPVGISYLGGWLLGLYFLAPVILESGSLSIRKQINAINPFNTNWMTTLPTLISPQSMPSEPTELGIAPTYGLHPAIGWILLAGFACVFYAVVARQTLPSKLHFVKPYLIPLISVFLLALFLTWSPLDIWSILPRQLWVTQFTFRFLTHIMWSGALLTAIAILLIFRHRLENRHLIIGILIIGIASRPWLPIPRGTVTVEELLKEPLFRYSGALDYLYRSPLKELYGNAELRLLHPDWIPGYSTWDVFINRPLLLDTEVFYPVWRSEEKPVLTLTGEVPVENIQDKANLLVLVNKQTLASIPLTDKNLTANIPFTNLKPQGEKFELKFQFEGNTKDGNPLYIRMKSLYFTGLSPKNTVLPVTKTQELCQQRGTLTDCAIALSPAQNIVQLPVLYYPRMQQVWVDGQLTEGFPSNYWDFNLLSLRLSPGNHQIQVKFVGLVWANSISALAWLGLLLITLFTKFSQGKKWKAWLGLPPS